MPGILRPWLSTVALVAMVACTTTPPAQVRESLDEVTGATIISVDAPMVYACPHPDLAVNARDYLNAALVDIDRMGKHRYYLVVEAWSTIDRRSNGIALLAAPEHLTLAPSGTALSPTTHQPTSLGADHPVFAHPTGYAGETWYELTATEARQFAESPPASITADPAGTGAPASYELWEDHSGSLRAFAQAMPRAPRDVNRR